MARHELRLRVGANKPFIGPVYSTDTGVWRHSAVIHLTFLLLVFISFGISLFPTLNSTALIYQAVYEWICPWIICRAFRIRVRLCIRRPTNGTVKSLDSGSYRPQGLPHVYIRNIPSGLDGSGFLRLRRLGGVPSRTFCESRTFYVVGID